MPITPRRASVLTIRHILVLATIASIILGGSLLMNTPSTQTTTPPEPTPPTEPIVPVVEESPPQEYVNVTGDLMGHIITNTLASMEIIRNAEGEIVEVYCRANWHAEPGLFIPEPPALTFVDDAKYWRGYTQDFTGYTVGEDFEVHLKPTGRVIFGFWWKDSTRSYKFMGYGHYNFTSIDPLVATLTLPEAYIQYPRGDGTYINAWTAFRRPAAITITIVSLPEP